jgi:hypothetical protein
VQRCIAVYGSVKCYNIVVCSAVSWYIVVWCRAIVYSGAVLYRGIQWWCSAIMYEVVYSGDAVLQYMLGSVVV